MISLIIFSTESSPWCRRAGSPCPDLRPPQCCTRRRRSGSWGWRESERLWIGIFKFESFEFLFFCGRLLLTADRLACCGGGGGALSGDQADVAPADVGADLFKIEMQITVSFEGDSVPLISNFLSPAPLQCSWPRGCWRSQSLWNIYFFRGRNIYFKHFYLAAVAAA